MARLRFHKLAPDKQRRIFDAVTEELLAKGYEGASLNQIIEQAGISKGALYYYFDDKNDLIATVMLDLFDRLVDVVDWAPEQLTTESFWPTLHAWSQAVLAKFADEPQAIGLGKLFYAMPYEMFADTALADKVREGLELFEAIVQRGQQLGVVRDDLPQGLLLAMLAGAAQASDRWMAEHWHELDPEEGVALSMRMIDMLRAMLAPPELTDP